MASDMYLKIEGVDGDSTDDKHQKWIEIQSFSLGVAHTGSGGSSALGSHSVGKADFSDLSIMKNVDSATPVLMLNCANGKHFDTITIECCRPTGEKVVYIKYVMKNVLISSVQNSGSSGGGTPSESVSFNYGELHWIYTPTDVKGKKGSDVKKGWSTEKNKEVAP